MPKVTINYAGTTEADILRIAEFYKDARPVGKAAVKAIRDMIALLATVPAMGSPVEADQFENLSYAREIPVRFGRSGYVVLYEFAPNSDAVTIIAIRHYREAGYSFEKMLSHDEDED